MKLYQIPRRIWMEPGCFSRVSDEARRLSATRAIVFAGPNIKKAGYVATIEAELNESGISVETFIEIEPEPSDETAIAAARTAREADADLVIGIGGGSNMDIAKAASVLARNEMTREELRGGLDFTHPAINKILIPTTAGTGSEVTAFAVLSNHEDDIKISLGGDELLPDAAILDPELTVTMPASVTASSGIDALTHAIEAFTSLFATSFSDMFAERAVKLIVDNIRKAYANGEDIEARSALLEASMLAGIAFGHAGVTAVHALSHPLGVKYRIPHGTANAVLLAPIMQFNLEQSPARLAKLAGHFGVDRKGVDDKGAAAKVVELLKELIGELGLTADLVAMDVKESDIREMAAAAMKEASIFCNPRTVELEDAESIYRCLA